MWGILDELDNILRGEEFFCESHIILLHSLISSFNFLISFFKIRESLPLTVNSILFFLRWYLILIHCFTLEIGIHNSGYRRESPDFDIRNLTWWSYALYLIGHYTMVCSEISSDLGSLPPPPPDLGFLNFKKKMEPLADFNRGIMGSFVSVLIMTRTTLK